MVNIRMRSAFTMIELIFAIVIISISMLTLPLILTVDANKQLGALNQEGILLASTKLSQTLANSWDSQSSPLGALMSTSQVLNTRVIGAGNLGAGLDRNGTSDFRAGHFEADLRRRLTPFSQQRNASIIGAETSGISSFHNTFEDINNTGLTIAQKRFAMKKVLEYCYLGDIC
ncbi:type II secretion system protein [Sulfurimonas sp. MAG313]|nr:type II secretion system protein [Sulfurimonas sp. MAG313]MDF1880683.1 type II secretion system protein [Sulfurimonas sp. MAG313]